MVYAPFIWVTGIHPKEAEKPVLKYSSIDNLFTRSLHANLRPIAPSEWVSPCDGRILDFGPADERQVIHVKDQAISIASFYPKFKVAQYMVIYLSPKDCHQVMMPADGLVQSIQFFPGGLSTVRPSYVVAHPEVLFRNARLNFNLEMNSRQATMIMVGALNVSSVSTPFSKQQRLPLSHPSKEMLVKQEVPKGDRVGTFHLGSTVVLLFEHPIAFKRDFAPGYRIVFGEALT